VTVTVVGSVAFDSLETPFGKRDKILGGAATHSALAASFFTDVRVVGVVGSDFGDAELAVFEGREVNTDDLERNEDERSFFWAGKYEHDMQIAQTLDTQLNVFAHFDPVLSPAARESSVVFLANIQPDVQRRVCEQCPAAATTGLDSMNYWISSARDSLLETMKAVDVVLLNDAELRMLTRESNLPLAARQIRQLGPRVVVAKLGSYGVAVFTGDGFFFVPGFPLESVVDPTGAGDSFAGGFFGYLDCQTAGEQDDDVLRAAAVYGSVMASFQIEAFGSERLADIGHRDIERRFREFRRMTHFEAQPNLARARARAARAPA
jgi:sugar/nucleoside kinase (ribokinase family)